MRVAALQLRCGDDPAANLPATRALIRRAVAEGAGFIATPEVTNLVATSRSHQRAVLRREAEDPTLAMIREEAARAGVWFLIGSLALLDDRPDGDGRFVNRSLLVDERGAIRARYDKIHMFDVAISPAETWRESEAFRPGDRAVAADTPIGRLGLSICYDVRFPHLYRRLAQAGCTALAVPAAFSPESGRAHWEVLLRARAIENGAFVLAPAQEGAHPIAHGRPRSTWGHSMIVGPWGEVLAEAPPGPGVILAEVDPAAAEAARRRIPSLRHDRDFAGP